MDYFKTSVSSVQSDILSKSLREAWMYSFAELSYVRSLCFHSRCGQ